MHTNPSANVAELLVGSKDPDRVALRLVSGDATYGDLQSASAKIARALLEDGGQKGDRAILLCENSFFWVAAYLGILRAGMVCVPLPSATLREELRYFLDDTDACFVLASAPLIAKYNAELAGVSVITERADGSTAAELKVRNLENLPVVSPDGFFAEVATDDLAALMFTSGSTGKPRGVMVSHRNIAANTESIIESLSLSEADSIMAVLPFHYCFGTSLLHTHLRVGGKLVIDSRFMYPEVILKRMQETGCTGFAGVPSHYQILLRNSSLPKKTFPCLRYVQQAGGHLAPSFIRGLKEALPGTQIYVMYGQTEATARLSCLPAESLERKLGSIGKAIPGVTLRILDDKGNAVPPNEVGEIVAEGENIARGYWRAPKETLLSFREGCLHTGDLARTDEDGFLYVVDRTKDFIKCGGKRVSCLQLEDVLLEFDGLLEAAVVGIPHDILGEAVKAYVVPRLPDATDLKDQLLCYCRTRMADALVPREIAIMRSLPKNSSGKVLRQDLKALQVQPANDAAPDTRELRAEIPHPITGRTYMQTKSYFSPDVLKLDPAVEVRTIQDAIREIVSQQLHRKGAVVGLSGGIDSSVTVALCAGALGAERVYGLMMPESDSSIDSVELGCMVARHYGIKSTVENITPILSAAGCYERRDHAICQVIPEYGPGWKSKIVLPSILSGDSYSVYSVIAVSPSGEEVRARMTADAYLGVVAATNFKQRTRKMLEYYHADRFQYAVAGTPNRLEHDLGFFVKLGDGAADFKPIARLYKSQVYQIAEYLGVPEEIRRRPPTTDTYSLEQSQEEFYFSLPLAKMDLCLYGRNHGVPVGDVAAALGLTSEQIVRVYQQIDSKRKVAHYLHCRPILIGESTESSKLLQ